MDLSHFLIRLGSAYPFICVVAVALMFAPLFPFRNNFYRLPSGFLFLVTLVLFHLPETFFRSALYTDESQLIVQGKMLLNGALPWLQMDPTTSGPLNSLWVLIAKFLFFEITPSTVRLTGLLTQGVSLILVYEGLKRFYSGRTSWLLTLVPWIFIAGHNMGLIKVYHSAVVTIFLFSAAFYFWARFETSKNRNSLYAALFLSGLHFLSKLQTYPAALTFGMIILIKLYVEQRNKKDFFKSLQILLGPVLLTFIFLLVTGGFSDFWQSYILMSLEYGEHYLYPFHPPHLPSPFSIDWSLSLWMIILGCTMIGSSLGMMLAKRDWRLKSLPFIVQALVTLLGVLVPGIFLKHYYFVLIIPFFLSLAMSFGVMIERRPFLRPLLGVAIFFTFIFYLKGNLGKTIAHIDPKKFEDVLWVKNLQQSLDHEGVRSASLVVWGWKPELYLMMDTIPSTRDTISQFAMISGPYQTYYLDRMLFDLKKNRPKFFMDAACWYTPIKQSCKLDGYPQLSSYIRENFEMKIELRDPIGESLFLWERKN